MTQDPRTPPDQHDGPLPISRLLPDEEESFSAPAPQIEGYEVLEKLGEAGQGQVWRAVQLSTGRQVALKVPRIGLLSSQKTLARFEREVEIAAQLRHPHIAQILDSGVHQGLYYYAMDLVEGRHLDQYVKDNSLSHRQILGLMRTICEAVQHAHQNGVIHRDLKPSNIIVTEAGHPYIVDFGLAKAVSAPEAPATISVDGEPAGTPAYMSPEQAAGHAERVDTRTDVYSLGAILFTLLTGQHPHDLSGSHLDVLRRITEGTITRPRVLDRRMDRDLEALLLKALEHDPDRRYSAAAGLAEDIDHYLGGRPISATPRSPVRHVGSFVRRHRVGVALGLLTSAAALAAVIILAAGTIIISRQKRQTQTAFEREQQALGHETQARMEAEQARVEEELARTEAQQQAKIAQAVASFLNHDLLASVSPARTRGRQVTVREILDMASQRIEGQFKDEPLIEAAVRQTLGNTYEALGEYAEAARQLEDACQLYREHGTENDRAVLESMMSLGWLYIQQGRYQEAQPLLLRSLEVAEAVLGEEHMTFLRCMNQVGVLYKEQGLYEKAQALYVRALAIQTRVLGERHILTLNTMHNLGTLYSDRGQYGEAEALYRRVVDAKTQQFGRDHPDTLRSVNNLAICVRAQHRDKEAEALFSSTLEIMRRVLGEEHPDTVRTTANLGGLYVAQGRYEDAEPLLRKAVETGERVLSEGHPDTFDGMRSLAVLYKNQNRFAEARQLYLRILEISRRALGDEHPDTLGAVNDLAGLYCDNDLLEEAEPLFVKAVQTMRRTLGEEHPNTLLTTNNLAILRIKQGRREEAESLWRNVAETAEQTLSRGHHERNRIMYVLVLVYRAWGKPDEAQAWQARLSEVESGSTSTYATADANLQTCTMHLRKIHMALRRYRDEKDTWPDRLSDLVPTYLDKDALLCPDDPVHTSPYHADPRLPCSYAWESSPGPIPSGSSSSGATAYRQWRTQQAKLAREVVPMVHCLHHGEGRVLTLSMTGQIYQGPPDWGYMFNEDRRRADDGSPHPAEPMAGKPSVGSDAPDPPLPEIPSPQYTRLVTSGWKASWSPDGTRLAFGRPKDQGVQILDLQSGETLDLTTSGKDPAWSPDGRFIAYVDKPNGDGDQPEEVWLITVSGDTRRRLTEGGYPTWSPDGKTLFIHSRRQNKILAVAVDRPDAEPDVFFDRPQSWYPAISPDGTRIAFGRGSELAIVDTVSGRTILSWPTPGRRGLLPAWSPDGSRVAFGGFDNDPFGVWILDVQAREAVRVIEGLHTGPAWSPDGTKLAFDHRSEDVREIWMVRTATVQGPKLDAAKAAEVSRALADPRLAGPVPSTTPRGNLLLGKPAPAFVLQDLAGQPVGLSGLKGKVVLLDFWASWCPPCVKAIPHLEALHQKYGEQGLVIIGLNDERDHAHVREFVRGRMSYPVLLDAAGQFTEYGIQSIPTYFYIDREGVVRHWELGFGEGKEKEIETRIVELLNPTDALGREDRSPQSITDRGRPVE